MNTKNITSLTKYKKIFRTNKMKVPAVLHVSDELMPGEHTFNQLEDVGSNDCVFHHIAAMNDVHSKPGRKNPTGTVVTSEKYILPQVNDSDPNCGMRFVRTHLDDTNTSPEDIEKLFKALVTVVPTKTWVGTKIPFNLVVDICRMGTSAAIKHFSVEIKNEIENSMSRGNFFGEEKLREDIFNVIPKLYLFFAKYRLGLLGAAGNHFLDLMKITDIEDDETARKFNLRKGQYIFMIHTGSGILGQYTMYTYTAKKREHLSTSIMVELGKLSFKTKYKKEFQALTKKVDAYRNGQQDLLTFDGDDMEGKMYMDARNAASNFGNANRMLIAHNVSESIKKILGKDPGFDLLYDMPHIYVGRENHYGKNLWVHRNGTSRAYGPSRMGHHPLFSQTGEPAFIPSSMSTSAYLGVGTDANESGFFSSGHGTGKAQTKTENEVPQSREALFEKMNRKGVKLYNAKSSRVVDQDASHYKNVDAAIETNRQNNVLNPVIKMQPVAVIMY